MPVEKLDTGKSTQPRYGDYVQQNVVYIAEIVMAGVFYWGPGWITSGWVDFHGYVSH